jgi:hypothetical protein
VNNVTEIELPGMPVWWPNDYGMAILFVLLGLAGAMAMVFLALSNWESLIGRTSRLYEIKAEIEEKREKAKNAKDAQERERWEKMIQQDEDCYDREMNRIRNLGILLYLVVGSIIALAFARNAIEAVGIGASWTAIVGIIGLKSESKEVSKMKNEVIGYIEAKLNTLEAKLDDLDKKSKDIVKVKASVETLEEATTKATTEIRDSLDEIRAKAKSIKKL